MLCIPGAQAAGTASASNRTLQLNSSEINQMKINDWQPLKSELKALGERKGRHKHPP